MPTQQTETRGGLAYAIHDGVALAGDLYLPAGAGPFPALVAVHGGGWQAGSKRDATIAAIQWATDQVTLARTRRR